MIKRLNPVSKELVLGILITGAVFQTIFMWFWASPLSFTAGLWIGIGISVGLALHMTWSIENALRLDEQGAVSHMRKTAVLRIAAVAGLFFAVYLLRVGNVVAVFLGLFGLKIGAYLQPFLHCTIQKKKIRENKKGK